MFKRFIVLAILNLTVVTTVNSSFRAPQFLADKDQIRNNRPIIGVLTQEADLALERLGKQYMSAHYVKLLETGGARVAPIFINSTEEQVRKMFSYVNGILMPGGHVKLNVSNYTRIGKQILELAKEVNDRGEVFPIWGECLGLELMCLLVAERNMSLGQYDKTFFALNDVENISLPLQTEPDYRSSRLLGRAPSSVIESFKLPITYNNHMRSLLMERYKKSEKLRDFFQVVGTSEKDGEKFVTMMEGRKYPVYLFHFHPSKPMFEWCVMKDIKHSLEAITVGQYLIDFFVQQARMNGHRFPSVEEEKAALIYNYSPQYTGDVISVLQTYLFD